MSERRLQIDAEESGRLDLVVAAQLGDFSRSQIQRLIRQGCLQVNGEPVTKPATALKGGERIALRIPPARPSKLEPEAIPLDVLYEDEHLIVVNKPAGMVVHPSPGHRTGTLVHAVLAHAPELHGVGGRRRPGVVHRLDKDTSGLILMAKDDRTHRFLQRQFKRREVQKQYLALVDGRPPTPQGRIEAPVGRDPKHRKRMAVVPGDRGRRAVTVYRTLERFARHTLLALEPETGRTHQIRVHLAFLDCPVVGDTTYGQRSSSVQLDRHFLHASELGIRIPDEDHLRYFHAPLPEELEATLARLRAG